jgi:four helix bundle protein
MRIRPEITANPASYKGSFSNGNSKSEARNPKQIQITKRGKIRNDVRLRFLLEMGPINCEKAQVPQNDGSRPFDLEERTFAFAKRSRAFVKKLARTIANIEDVRQLIRSSGSVGANYIEANESLSKKDIIVRIKIARKEAKESRYWLRLLEPSCADSVTERDQLIQEAQELMKILGAILRKSE